MNIDKSVEDDGVIFMSIKGDFEITIFLPMINNQLKPNDNIRLLVTDTLGNKYYSKKTKYKNFLNNVQISREVNLKK